MCRAWAFCELFGEGRRRRGTPVSSPTCCSSNLVQCGIPPSLQWVPYPMDIHACQRAPTVCHCVMYSVCAGRQMTNTARSIRQHHLLLLQRQRCQLPLMQQSWVECHVHANFLTNANTWRAGSHCSHHDQLSSNSPVYSKLLLLLAVVYAAWLCCITALLVSSQSPESIRAMRLSVVCGGPLTGTAAD